MVCDWSQTLCLKPFFEEVFASSRRCACFASAFIRILRKSLGPVGGCDLKLDWFAIGLREVLASASPQGLLYRSSCQQCSFHGIASSQSIADPYTQVRKEYERSTITPTLPPTLHFTFHRLECIVPPIRRHSSAVTGPRERTELPFETEKPGVLVVIYMSGSCVHVRSVQDTSSANPGACGRNQMPASVLE